MRARRAVARGGAAGVVLLLTACSGGPGTTHEPTRTGPAAPVTAAADPYAGMLPADILTKAAQNAQGAEVVRVRARYRSGRSTVRTDVRMRNDRSAVGSLWFDGHEVTVRRLGPDRTLWFRADARFWREMEEMTAGEADRVADRWMRTTEEPEHADEDPFFYWTDWDVVVGHLGSATPERLHRVPGVTIEGRPTVGVSDRAAGKRNAESRTVYLPATGTVLAARVVFPESHRTDPDRIELTGWHDAYFSVRPPSGPVTDLGAGAGLPT